MQKVTATEFAKHFGKYRELVQREPVAVTSHERVSGYFISDADYAQYMQLKAFLPRPLAVEALPEPTLKQLENSHMDARHAHLDSLLED